MQHNLTTTTWTLEGYRITRQLGVVRGIIVRSRSVFGNIGAALQTLAGGNITILTQLCEKTRGDAFDLMLWHAEALGANAVVGIQYDATEVMQGVTEVLCYGPAVVVQPAQTHQARRLLPAGFVYCNLRPQELWAAVRVVGIAEAADARPAHHIATMLQLRGG